MLRSKFLRGLEAVSSYIRGCGRGTDWVSTSVLFRRNLAGVGEAGVRAARLPNDLVGADTPGSLGASLNSHPTTQIALEWSNFTRRDRVKIPPVPHPPCSGESLGPISPVDCSEPKILLNSFLKDGAGRHFVNGSASM